MGNKDSHDDLPLVHPNAEIPTLIFAGAMGAMAVLWIVVLSFKAFFGIQF